MDELKHELDSPQVRWWCKWLCHDISLTRWHKNFNSALFISIMEHHIFNIGHRLKSRYWTKWFACNISKYPFESRALKNALFHVKFFVVQLFPRLWSQRVILHCTYLLLSSSLYFLFRYLGFEEWFRMILHGIRLGFINLNLSILVHFRMSLIWFAPNNHWTVWIFMSLIKT